jgi:hypothetical protein
MWIQVWDCNSHAAITNAFFSVSASNAGNGWYWMYIDNGQNFGVGAAGYATVYGNTDSWGQMWASLCPIPPPPPTYGNCWSG